MTKRFKCKGWIVFRDGAVWTNLLDNEAECLFHIDESVDNFPGWIEDDYEYREMNEEELLSYDYKRDENGFIRTIKHRV